MNPKTHALRYRIWAYAAPRGWDVTTAEVADALGVSTGTVGQVIRGTNWAERFRGSLAEQGMRDWQGSIVAASRYIAADVIAGRISHDPVQA